jgi:hypothetical protein
MATKAERFRYESERAGAPAPKTKKVKKKRIGVSSAQGLSQGRKAMFALETSAPATTPSRKSTRKSKNRQKAATALTGRTLLSKSTPQARHGTGAKGARAPR